MTLHFVLRYRTVFGENLWLSAKTINNKGNTETSLLPMHYLNDEEWELRWEIDQKEINLIQYHYILKGKAGFDIRDGERDRVLHVNRFTKAEKIYLTDAWNNEDDFRNNYFTAPFLTIFNHKKGLGRQSSLKQPRLNTHVFKVKAPMLETGQVVCILGNAPELSNWSTSDPLKLQNTGNWWMTSIPISEETSNVEYKYGIYDQKRKQFLRYEEGANRIFHNPRIKENQFFHIHHNGFLRVPVKLWKGAGVAVPVFSLRSKKGAGTGEFSDLKLLADWAKTAGIKLIQILPVNDTIANHDVTDSYPYAAISAFALNPLYLNLDEMAKHEHLNDFKVDIKTRRSLNSSESLNYNEVINFKFKIIKEVFQKTSASFLNSPEFNNFFNSNKDWLIPYAVFCYLRDKYKTPDFTRWKSHGKYNSRAIEQFASSDKKHFHDIAIFYFIQYHLHRQLSDAVNYIHSKGVALKGDIPIGIYRYSCDAWMHPELFIMNQQAGAPPDAFSDKGQNWGFPTYNWKKMKEDGFWWWKRRFEQMSLYFDAFRIDHILGFFRIWSIPIQQVEGDMGYFVPAIPLKKTELENRGFNLPRLTSPYITDELINELFLKESEEIKQRFLTPKGNGEYQFKSEFQTQRQILDHFNSRKNNDNNTQIINKLNSLISNLILLKDPEQDDGFHFRFNMETTYSFRKLDDHTRESLMELYNDYFFKRQDELWEAHAMEILPLLKDATNMLIIGEDLGVVPDCVPHVMKRLGILSLEIQRMPKEKGRQFGDPSKAPYLSVVSPGTHDMSTIRGWWEEDPATTRQFYSSVIGEEDDVPQKCEAWINRAIVIQHLKSTAMWAVIQIQDILGMEETLRRENPDDERINIPSDNKHVWNYRMHIHLEDLLMAREFNEDLRREILLAGR